MVHAVCLAASGAAMLASPGTGSEAWLYVSMIGIGAGLGWAGLGWASMMGNPYVMLTIVVPPAKFGVFGYFQYVHRRANDDREPDGAIGLP